MSKITRQDLEKLYEEVGERCRCTSAITCPNGSQGGHIHPILIGNVLGPISVAWTEEQQEEQWLECVRLWHECSIDKPLQEIERWEENGCFDGKHGVEGANCGGSHENCKPGQRLTPEAESLFQFLIDLFLTDEG